MVQTILPLWPDLSWGEDAGMLETAHVSWNKRRFELHRLMPPAGHLVQGYMDLTSVLKESRLFAQR